MKSLCWLTLEVLASAGIMCGAPTRRDAERILARVEHEGDSFLTIALPSFATDFLQSLDQGQVAPSSFMGFKRLKKADLPAFLSGFLTRVFDKSGAILPNPDVQSISCVLQICNLHKKVLLPCTRKRELSAERNYMEVDKKCAVYNELDRDDPSRKMFRSVAGVILSDMTKGFQYGIPETWQPRHGPGANTNRSFGNEKWTFSDWYSRFDWFFPWAEYGHGSYPEALSLLNQEAISGIRSDTPHFLDPSDEEPVKVVFVPKTLKSPRVIAVESQAMQFAQQGMRQWLVECIERSTYTSGKINFSDQKCNQSLALSASKNGFYATIDMKDASDLVTQEHVHDLFAVNPLLTEMIFALRSTHARLPSGVVIPLQKYASMGSATCFPVEALAFFVAIVSARLQAAHRVPSPANIRKECSQVFVYGDDIIVPAHEAPGICDALEYQYKFRVNRHKSFWTGKYRESCGSDAYDGTPVTPVYCRRTFPADSRDAESIVSWVSMANQFYMIGHWSACQRIREAIEKLLRLPLPFVSNDSGILGWKSIQQWRQIHGWDKKLQRYYVSGFLISAHKVSDILSDFGALRKCLSLIKGSASKFLEPLPTIDVKHLTQSVRRSSVALRRSRAPVY